MSARIPDTHAEAWALLPWLANGRIAPEDREWVEAHLQGCAECRAELAAQRLVASHVTQEGSGSPASPPSDEQRSFNKLWARIEASESATPATGTAGMPVQALLGYAIAHELGHLLLASNAHNTKGLMRPIWRDHELRSARSADWTFTGQEVAAIRRRR